MLFSANKMKIVLILDQHCVFVSVMKTAMIEMWSQFVVRDYKRPTIYYQCATIEMRSLLCTPFATMTTLSSVAHPPRA